MRILFLLDSPKNKDAKERILSLLPALKSAEHDCGVVSFRPGKIPEVSELGTPLRVLQFIDLKLNFYAPGLVGCVGLFRPDAVIFSSAGTLVQGGPLVRTFKGLPIVSIASFPKRPGWFSRHALKRARFVFFPDEISRENLRGILSEEKIAPLSVENFLSFFTAPKN